MSLKAAHSYHLTREICGRLLGAFSTRQIVLESIGCFTTSCTPPEHFAFYSTRNLGGGGAASGLRKEVEKNRGQLKHQWAWTLSPVRIYFHQVLGAEGGKMILWKHGNVSKPFHFPCERRAWMESTGPPGPRKSHHNLVHFWSPDYHHCSP